MEHTVSKYGLKEGAEEFPLMVVLGYIYKCNANCPNCPYNYSSIRNDREIKEMPWNVFNRVVDEAAPYKAYLRMTGGGEPFLHSDIAAQVEHAVTKGCGVGIITNGSKSVNEVLGVASAVEFSVDAGTKEDYHRARPGLSWHTLNINVDEAVKNKGNTKIVASVINQKGIDVDAAVKYWEKIVDVVQVRKFLTWGYNEDNSADATPYLPPEKTVPCPWLFERIYVDASGEITYCNANINLDNAFANIKDRTIKEAWRGPEMEKLRELHVHGRGAEFPMCGKCPDWQYRSWTHNYWKLMK